MCFIIKEGLEKPYIASRDIRCYKIMTRVSGRLESRIRGFRYKEGVEYKRPFQIKLSKPRRPGDYINIGYHSYRTKKHAEGLICYQHDVVVSCIIPKGTLFFKNTNEYVSNGIKIEGIVH